MRFTLLLFALCFTAGAASGKPKKGKPDPDEERAERERLQLAIQQEAPALLDWFQTFFEPKLKITAVDTSRAPELRFRFSLLGWDQAMRNAAPVPDLDKAILEGEVFLATGEEKRPKSLVTFGEGGASAKEGPAARIVPMDKAGIPLDVVVIAAGHAGYKGIDALEESHKKALGKLLTGLEGARVNLIWHGPLLYTYRALEGMDGGLARFDEEARGCEGARLRWRIDSTAEPKEGEAAAPLPPCGLLEGVGGTIATAVGDGSEKNPGMPFRGRHSRLFDIYKLSDACAELDVSSTAIRNLNLDAVADVVIDKGAFEEGLRLLATYGRPEARKELIVLGDGRDGYIDDEQICRDRLTDGLCGARAKDLKGKSAVEAVRACVQAELDRRSTTFQERFAAKVPTWIGLMRALDIRVHAIGYNMQGTDGAVVSHGFERERLELLALQTGGTYREVVNRPVDAVNAVDLLLAELAQERVVMVAADLPAESRGVAKFSLTLGGDAFEGLVLESQEWTFGTGPRPSGWRFWLEKKDRWLRHKVGMPWYWFCVVGFCLLGLFLLWMFWKLVKAIFLKLFGGVLKAGKDAAGKAKGAAKGAQDAAKKAGSGVAGAAGKAGKGALDAAKKSAPKAPK